MHRSELQFDLPPERIAQHAAEPRDAARLLVLDRGTGRIEHRVFREIAAYLSPGDGLVLNDTRVVPARFFCRRHTGRRIEGLFQHVAGDVWRVMLRSSRLSQPGERLVCEGHPTELIVTARLASGEWLLRPDPPIAPFELLAKIGQTPLPPYIYRGDRRHSQPEPQDAERYQTVYAERPGAIAAPTAGLHFTPELLERLAAAGVRRAMVTLHVGAGTFVPIKVEDLAQHRMHTEWFEATPTALATLHDVRAAGGRIVAVGTTSLRVLESLPDGALQSRSASGHSGLTDIFIYPPYRFRHVDRLITNFHVPGSTLLALVMAFASPEQIRAAYAEAIRERYRFYSFGDAMLIL